VRKSSRHPYDSGSLRAWQIARGGPLAKTTVSELRQIVDRYLALAGRFGPAVPLASFGLGAEETSRLFSSLDEDYQISRYLKLSHEAGAEFSINGFPQTHVALDEAIRSLL
jgi:hypothetical protein